MDPARTEPDETTRLLTDQTDEVRDSDDRSPEVPRQRLMQKQILLLSLVFILLQSHLIFFNIASREAKLWQICRKWYKDHGHDQIGTDGNSADWARCYLQEEVMMQLRDFLNWEKGISFIMLLLIVIPYGKFADFRGKKKVIMLALIGQLLSCSWIFAVVSFPDIFPLKLTWAGPIFWLVGGGTSLSITLIYLLASESLHEEQRTTLYFSLYGVFVVIEFFFTEIAYVMAIFSVFIPISISLGFLGVSFIALIFVDESAVRDDAQRQEDAETTVTHLSDEGTVLSPQLSGQSKFLALLRSRQVLFTLFVFILPVLAHNASRWLFAYSYMIRGPYQSVGQIIMSVTWGNLFKLVLFTLLVPWFVPFVQKRFGVRQSAVDVWIIRGSIMHLAFAAAYVTVATTSAARIIASVTLAMGSGLRMSLLSYTTSLAGPELRGRLYGAVQVMETVGQIITWPMSEQATIDGWKDNSWLEWPFFILSIASVCVLAVAMISRISFN